MKPFKILFIASGVILIFLLIFLLKGGDFSSGPSADSLDSTFREPVIGIFERDKRTQPQTFVHYALKLDKYVDKMLISSLLAKIPPAKNLILTIYMPGTDYGSSPDALKDISDGDYDSKIKAFCQELKKRRGSVYLRWNPEMEVPVQLFPWQYKAPADYIDAFMHFSGLCKYIFPAVKMVWGPAGYPGADEFWPGELNVDLISVTLNGISESKATAFPPVKDREIDLRRKIQRMRFFKKPVLVMHSGNGNEPNLKNELDRAIAETRLNARFLYPDRKDIRVNGQEREGVPLIGVYDPKAMLINTGLVGVEHLFIDLENVQNGQFEKEFKAITARRHDAIVSIEPWRDLKVRKDSSVLTNVINGIYDAEFAEIYRIISGTDQTVYLRFAHEMEIPIQRYAWQSQDPVLYIKAYRYFMNFDKSQNKRIKKVWGPAGDRGSMEWWPGSDVVDYISIAIYGLPDKNITDPNQQESFEDIFNRKRYRMRMANKPIFITEFGVKGPEGFQQKWLNQAAAVIRSQNQITGICYFNLADNPKVWGNIPAPDWSVSKETFESFVKALSEND